MEREEKLTQISVPTKNNELLEKALEKINTNTEIHTLWRVINVNAIDRMKYSDHGPVHVQIVANVALRLMRILHNADVKMAVEKDYKLSYEHAELVVFLASLMHDLGMSISRRQHEEFSLILANDLLKELLDFLPTEERIIIKSEVLHSIISHRKGGDAQTLEAGIVRVSDALDMSEGRARVAYESGEKNIHAVSASAINGVDIKEGNSEDGIIQILIKMNNSAGLFQIDDLMAGKIKGTGLEKYIAVRAIIDGETEKKLMEEYIIKDF